MIDFETPAYVVARYNKTLKKWVPIDGFLRQANVAARIAHAKEGLKAIHYADGVSKGLLSAVFWCMLVSLSFGQTSLQDREVKRASAHFGAKQAPAHFGAKQDAQILGKSWRNILSLLKARSSRNNFPRIRVKLSEWSSRNCKLLNRVLLGNECRRKVAKDSILEPTPAPELPSVSTHTKGCN